MLKKASVWVGLFLWTNIVLAQSFGCYDVSIDEGNRYAISERSFDKIDWKKYSINQKHDSAFIVEYHDYELGKNIPSLKMIGQIVNDKQQGKWILYSMDHSKKAVGSFTDGKKNGLWKIYTKLEKTDTFLSEVCYFRDDVLDQNKIRLNAIGDTIELEVFKNGIPHGVHAQFANNKLDTFFFENFNNGKKDGVSYSRFKQEGQWFYRYEADYKNNKLAGRVKKYHENGQLFYHIIYKDNLPLTIVEVFDICGRKLDGGDLKDGNGILNFYSDSGKIESSFFYNNQAINGQMVHYYESGKIFEKGKLFSRMDSSKPAEHINLLRYQDYNLKAAYQLIFRSPTDYEVYTKNGFVESSIKSTNSNAHSDTILTIRYNENRTIASKILVY